MVISLKQSVFRDTVENLTGSRTSTGQEKYDIVHVAFVIKSDTYFSILQIKKEKWSKFHYRV